jgi:hypothetical protein
MATLTEYIPKVIAYLIAQAQASTLLGAAQVPVTIIDGQPRTQDVLTVNSTGLTQRLWIGSDGWTASGEMATAASADQGFSFLDQARTRDDQIEVFCAGEAIAGDSVMAEARAGAFAVMAAIETMLRGSPGTTPASPGDATMGGLVFWSEAGGPIELSQGQISQGACALVKFSVHAFVRLTS